MLVRCTTILVLFSCHHFKYAMQLFKTGELHLVMKLISMSIGTHPEKTSQPKATITEEHDQGIVSATVDDVCCMVTTSLSIFETFLGL